MAVAGPAGHAPLAVSLGDPAGIGPECIAEAWARRRDAALPPFFVVHGTELLRRAAEARGLTIAVRAIAGPEETAAVFDGALPVLGARDADYRPGEPDGEGAALALASLTDAVEFARKGTAGAVVTAPISKAELARVGFTQPGQTEFLADACGLPRENAVMMLAGPTLRTVPLTVHAALSQVPALLSRELIVHRARIVAAALRRDFGLAGPRLAITGLNPHAGEEGRFGDEEIRIIAPAVAQLREEGIAASGPHPADALFAPHARAGFDAALCMYHDQALIPIKALEFDAGVNTTLGLPIVRTSPDHGTAFAIAGQRTARADATIAAIRLAGQCAARRLPA
ncbi:4-hydroxythreonine-4-phosphate dehydrogenase PdxA [Novosphingobium sp. PC22D]|uniref:4-hydroxythreonine-4-phosphate dehydrogenase PdxA n=1 Tax=Novosphingobium sp. PC22D TaxID=1962403 RepID=UPI000BF04906|nr:4-hydroxythreonine-4-phosphate dehydrogenase PdxA [Novosphingobium sp. PC22D]PEQ11490.1 4-hydroxythreonine-4-phosphate dehydrogenase PdxA [Novosphingobium sp. PC22D]